jgi:hypothetical protein
MVLDPATTARESWYSERRWERWAPLAGVLAVVLWVVAVIIGEAGAGTPDEGAGAQAIAAFFEDNSGTLLAGSFLFMLGAAVFLWFLGSLRARFLAADPSGRITAIVFAAGVATAVLTAAAQAPIAGGAVAAGELERSIEPAAAEVFWDIGDGFFLAATTMLAVFFFAAFVAILRTRAFPTWFAWLSLLFAVVAVIGPIGWLALVFGLPIWTLVASVWMFMRPAGDVVARPADARPVA